MECKYRMVKEGGKQTRACPSEAEDDMTETLKAICINNIIRTNAGSQTECRWELGVQTIVHVYMLLRSCTKCKTLYSQVLLKSVADNLVLEFVEVDLQLCL